MATLGCEGIIFMMVSCGEGADRSSIRLYLLGVSRGVILMSRFPAAPWTNPQTKGEGGGTDIFGVSSVTGSCGGLELALNRFHQRFRLRRHAGPEARHYAAVPGDQKLFE